MQKKSNKIDANANELSKDILVCIATCPKGIEHLLCKELKELGIDDVQESVAAVFFKATLQQIYKSCIWSRLANKIALVLYRGFVNDVDEFSSKLVSLPWSDYFEDAKTIAVDFNGSNASIRDARYGAQLTKDAINQHFLSEGHQRLQVDTRKPDILIYMRLFKQRLVVGIDLVGESLHKRGYRLEGADAPLKENLAAAILYLAEWPEQIKTKDDNNRIMLLDPMCGSGTLLIEAALMAGSIPPSFLRNEWSLKNLKNFSADIWKMELEQSRSSYSLSSIDIKGYDKDSATLKQTINNIKRAGLEKVIDVEQAAIENLAIELPERGLVVVNPPYGKRLGDQEELVSLYKALGNFLMSSCQQWKAAIFTGNPQLSWETGLKSHRQYKLFNGAIPCQLQRFLVSEENTIRNRRPADRVVAFEELSESASMLANRLNKNVRRLSSWLKQHEGAPYRVYDADLPEYAFALDYYSSWEMPDSFSNNLSSKSDELKALVEQPQSLYFHLQEYAPPDSIDLKQAKRRLEEAKNAVSAVFEVPRDRVIIKQRQKQKGTKQYQKQDIELPDLLVKEHGHLFIVNLGKYLDSGLFLDHRSVRKKIQSIAKGKRFLNLFSYTSSATVYAACAGARSSISVDMSKTYNDWSIRNFIINGLQKGQHQVVRGDCLKWLEECDKQFDCILLDPPSFSNSSKMEGTLDIQRDHTALIDKAMSCLTEGGELFFSNNKKGFTLSASILEKYQVRGLTHETIDPDFNKKKPPHQCWLITH